MTPTFSPGDRVRLRESVEVYGVRRYEVTRMVKGLTFTVRGWFRGNVEVMTGPHFVTLPARLLERC